ncbi:MAG: glycosyltransferase family 4 protein [Pyrinomonadaceae bacterium]
MTTTLYICYFGVRQPLVRTQVIPYLQELAKGGIAVNLLTFEPDLKSEWTPEQIDAERRSLAELGISWRCLAYHKRPSAIATAWDIFAGARLIRKLIAAEDIDILHGRSHVATLMGALARKYSSHKPKLIFDIRGFFPEEYTDAGVWPENGLLFRSAKRVENWLMKESDGFVVLTEKAREILFEDAGTEENLKSEIQNSKLVEIIPCCVDFETRFPVGIAARRDEMREKLGMTDRRVFVHVGALGGLYLTRELADFMAAARENDSKTYALFLTQSDPTEITALLRERGFSDTDFFVGRVDPTEIPIYLSASDVGLSFVKATYATQSRSPTKIPEYLAAGLPIIANSGVGDVDSLIRDDSVGVLIDQFDRESYIDAIEQISQLGDISEHCRETAVRRFDLETVGGVRYRQLYESVLKTNSE